MIMMGKSIRQIWVKQVDGQLLPVGIFKSAQDHSLHDSASPCLDATSYKPLDANASWSRIVAIVSV